EIFEVFVFVPISIILLGLVVYRFSPAYEVNKGKLWAIKPEWNYKEIKREAEAGGMLVPANLYRDQAKLSLEDKPQLDPKDKVQ
ncbi:MAG: hypothetical protein QW688_07035, partial [Thermoprotei archaeon]